MKCELYRIRTEEFRMGVGDFSNYLKVNYATYRGWEKGNSSPPLEVALSIAETLKRRVEDIWHK